MTPLDAITFANQNMQVAASKQNDYRNRIESQKYAVVAKMVEKETSVSGVDELTDDQKIDAEREHNKEHSEEETGEKAKETQRIEPKKPKVEVKEEKVLTTHILDIKV